jgi:uncharacterized protein (TIGR02996 family)
MTDEAAFLAGIRAEPKDDLRRLVYADWLDEQGSDEHRAKAEYLRLEVHVGGLADDHPERDGLILKLRAVAEGLAIGWKTDVAKAPIENCEVRWRFQCPKRWNELELIDNFPDMRFCTACRKTVTYCGSVGEARRVAEHTGNCVAVDRSAVRKPLDMAMLRSPPELDSEGFEVGDLVIVPDDFNPGAPGDTPPPPAHPGLLRRLWRRLTGK